MVANMPSVFLSARWEHIVLANYAVDSAILQNLIPLGTELDPWDGESYVSLVGFMFERSKILGLPIPFHGSFEEVNLRFYVRRKVDGQWRRGVVFVKELVPKCAVTWVARSVYHENYATVPMSHRLILDDNQSCTEIAYAWGSADSTCELVADLRGARDADTDERARFFADHYWGYSQRGDMTIEYQVEHPPWHLREPAQFKLSGDLAPTYGRTFADALACGPRSVFVAGGSAISVRRGNVL